MFPIVSSPFFKLFSSYLSNASVGWKIILVIYHLYRLFFLVPEITSARVQVFTVGANKYVGL